MKILVTGGAGFVGSHFCDFLLGRGHNVVAADNLSLGREANIAHLAGNSHFQFLEGDLLNPVFMSRLFPAGPSYDLVVHLAANSDIAASHARPSTDFDDTLSTTFRVLECMRVRGLDRIIFASTSAVYGEVEGRISEDHGPTFPISHYGAAKLASEGFLSSFGEGYGIRSWITRFPNVVGGRSTHGAVHDFIGKLRRDPTTLEVLGDGQQTKPYLHVKDVVEAIWFVFEKANARINVYNISSVDRTRVADIAAMVVEEMQLSARIVYTGGARGWVGDVPRFEYDTSRLERLGWTPPRTSDESVRAAIRDILTGKGCNW